jgi:hypothetical protein
MLAQPKSLNLCWHYTALDILKKIYTDGEIRPATAYVPDGERPIVWFSCREDWEPTATKMFKHRLTTVEEIIALSGGLGRIGVHPETAPYVWQQLKWLTGMSDGLARRLEKAALKWGSYSMDWRGTFNPVPSRSWIAIEVSRDGMTWRPWPVWGF